MQRFVCFQVNLLWSLNFWAHTDVQKRFPDSMSAKDLKIGLVA